MNFDGILFDKDGTLFDFHKTWSNWTSDAIEYLCGDNSAKKKLVAKALGYDQKNQSFLKNILIFTLSKKTLPISKFSIGSPVLFSKSISNLS